MTDPSIEGAETATTRVVVRPNASASAGFLVGFMTAVSVVGLGAAGYFALHGLWVPLPLAGLELAALALTLRYVYLRSRRYECIVIDDQHVRVEQRMPDGAIRGEQQLARDWVQLVLLPGRWPQDPRRLVLRERGRSVEIGACLLDDERHSLMQFLAARLAPSSVWSNVVVGGGKK